MIMRMTARDICCASLYTCHFDRRARNEHGPEKSFLNRMKYPRGMSLLGGQSFRIPHFEFRINSAFRIINSELNQSNSFVKLPFSKILSVLPSRVRAVISRSFVPTMKSTWTSESLIPTFASSALVILSPPATQVG